MLDIRVAADKVWAAYVAHRFVPDIEFIVENNGGGEFYIANKSFESYLSYQHVVRELTEQGFPEEEAAKVTVAVLLEHLEELVSDSHDYWEEVSHFRRRR